MLILVIKMLKFDDKKTSSSSLRKMIFKENDCNYPVEYDLRIAHNQCISCFQTLIPYIFREVRSKES